MEERILQYCSENEEGYTALQPARGGRRVGLPLKAIEVEGTIDAQRRLQLDEPLPIVGPSRVRVIILIPDETDINEQEWLHAAASNPAFDFLKEPDEDIYTLADGEPFYDQG
jgi:hypothetical protein